MSEGKASHDGCRSTLQAIVPALFVLRAVCRKAKLIEGERKAEEMIGWTQRALLASERRFGERRDYASGASRLYRDQRRMGWDRRKA